MYIIKIHQLSNKPIMSAITLTLCDRAENHVGMEQIGDLADEGFTIKELENVKEKIGDGVEIIELECEGEEGKIAADKAWLLIIRDGVNKICDGGLDELKREQFGLVPDRKAFMYGRVVNKHARGNLCFDEVGHEPDYENKKGTVIGYDSVPMTKLLRERIGDLLGDKGKDLACEGNYYYDIKKCGIGFHGDAERRKVIGVRLGDSIPLHFQWFHKSKSVGKRMKFELNDGDMYVMSDKAVGFDWKKKSIMTLRHAAGSDKFLEIKEKVIKEKVIKEKVKKEKRK
jgi:alkylated DNA repair dioxygenase AlkB